MIKKDFKIYLAMLYLIMFAIFWYAKACNYYGKFVWLRWENEKYLFDQIVNLNLYYITSLILAILVVIYIGIRTK